MLILTMLPLHEMNIALMNTTAERVVMRNNAPGSKAKVFDQMVYDPRKPFDKHPKGHYRYKKTGRAGIARRSEYIAAIFGDAELGYLALKYIFEQYDGKTGEAVTGYPTRDNALELGHVASGLVYSIRRPPPLKSIGQDHIGYVGNVGLEIQPNDPRKGLVVAPLITFGRDSLPMSDGVRTLYVGPTLILGEEAHRRA